MSTESNTPPVQAGTTSGNPEEVPDDLVALQALVREHAARGGAEATSFLTSVVGRLAKYRDTHPAVQATILLEVAVYFYNHADNAAHGLEAAMSAARLARLKGDKPLLRKATSFLGVLSQSFKNFRGAIEHTVESLELAVELGERLGQAAAANNIGATLLELADYEDDAHLFDDALGLFRFALAMAPDSAQGQQITRSSMVNIALIYLNRGEHMAGVDAIVSAIQMQGEPRAVGDYDLRVLSEWCYTRLLLWLGDTEEAKLHATLAKAFAAKARTHRAMFYAEASEAMCEAYSGHGDVGLSRLVRALEKSRGLGVHQRDMLASTIQLVQQKKDDKRADYYRGQLRKLVADEKSDSKVHLLSLQGPKFMKLLGATDSGSLSELGPMYNDVSRERVRRAIAKAI